MQRRAWGIVAAFLAVYVIWGSTYLAIRYAVETMPPFLMASARWLVAGAALYAWRRAAGDARPTARHWLSASVIGVALVLGGNGLVSWAEQWVPSGLAALIIAIVPLWITLLVWRRTKVAPTARAASGILLGLLGVAVLFGPAIAEGLGGSTALLFGTIAILVATMSWALGSVYSRTAQTHPSILLAAAMQMLAGGAALGLVGLGMGEGARVDLGAVDLRAWLSFAFLVVFGSIVAYSAYVWLLRVVRAELVATYAFVNPIVAVLLGTLFAAEPFTTGTLVASALIVVGVALVVTGGARPRPREPSAAIETES